MCNSDYGARTYLCLPPASLSGFRLFTSTTHQLGDCLLQGATWFGAEAKKL